MSHPHNEKQSTEHYPVWREYLNESGDCLQSYGGKHYNFPPKPEIDIKHKLESKHLVQNGKITKVKRIYFILNSNSIVKKLNTLKYNKLYINIRAVKR